MREFTRSFFSLAMDMGIFMARGVSRTLSGDGHAFLNDSQKILKKTADATQQQLGPELGQVSEMGREVQARMVDAAMGSMGSNEVVGVSQVMKLGEDTVRRMSTMLPMNGGMSFGVSTPPTRMVRLGEQVALDAGRRICGENAAAGGRFPSSPAQFTELMAGMLTQSTGALSGGNINFFGNLPMDPRLFVRTLEQMMGQWTSLAGTGAMPDGMDGIQNWVSGFLHQAGAARGEGGQSPVVFMDMFQQVMTRTLGGMGGASGQVPGQEPAQGEAGQGTAYALSLFNPLYWMKMGADVARKSAGVLEASINRREPPKS